MSTGPSFSTLLVDAGLSTSASSLAFAVDAPLVSVGDVFICAGSAESHQRNGITPSCVKPSDTEPGHIIFVDDNSSRTPRREQLSQASTGAAQLTPRGGPQVESGVLSGVLEQRCTALLQGHEVAGLVVGHAVEPAAVQGNLRLKRRDARRQYPQLRQQGLDQQAGGADDRLVGVQWPLFADGLDSLTRPSLNCSASLVRDSFTPGPRRAVPLIPLRNLRSRSSRVWRHSKAVSKYSSSASLSPLPRWSRSATLNDRGDFYESKISRGCPLNCQLRATSVGHRDFVATASNYCVRRDGSLCSEFQANVKLEASP